MQPVADSTTEGVSKYTPRVLVFGLPRSGKTDLIRVINKLAVADSGVDVVNLTPVGTNPAIQGEVLRWVVPSPEQRPGSESVVLYDCDGQAARELLKSPDFVTRRTGRSALIETVRASHALVCLVNASANEGEVRDTFRDMSKFVGGFKRGRLINREVGGMPVFLVLTRCDELWTRGQDRGEWQNLVEQRVDWLRNEFREFFGTDFAVEESEEGTEVVRVEGAGPFGFGTLDVRVRAVARQLPAFTDTTAHDEPWQVRELFHEFAEAARQYAFRAIASRRRLRATLGGAGLLVGTLFLGLAMLLASGGFGQANALAERVRAVRATEGPPATRLADRNLARNTRELTAIRATNGYDRLPNDLREFVASRLREYDAYREYRTKFRAPRLGPAEIRTREQLDALATALRTDLTPPVEYASAWTDTDAAKLWRKWQADQALFTDAETQLHDWYRAIVRQANDLLLTSTPPDYGWRVQVTDLLRRGDAPPFPPDQEIATSPVLPILRGRKLTYAAVYAFDRVASAKADWADTRIRLLHLRDLTDALGMTTGPGTAPAVLDLPEPGPSAGDSRLLAVSRLAALRAAFPAPAYPDPDYPQWNTDRFPDPVRSVLAGRLRQAFDTGTRHVRRLVMGALGDAANAGSETHADWKRVADTLLQEETMRAWGRLLGRYRAWADPQAPTTDPVAEMVEFVRRDRFDVVIQSATVSIPDALLLPRFVPDGRLVITHTPTGGPPADYAYRREGDGRRDPRETAYLFVPDDHGGTFPLRPGDGLSATLTGRSGVQEFRLVWSAGHSSVYQMDRLAHTPRLERIGVQPIPESAPGVRLNTLPAGGLPLLPAVFPDLRGGAR